MSKLTVITLALVVLGLCITYWEWRYKEYGWGRGWMRPTAQTWSSAHFPAPSPELERFVWGTDPTIPVLRVPKDWDFDLPLPPA